MPAARSVVAAVFVSSLLASRSSAAAPEDPWANLDAPDATPAAPAPAPSPPLRLQHETELRPIRIVSFELNPLAVLLAKRLGGQIGVGLFGPLALVGGVSAVDLSGEPQRCSSYDTGAPETYGRPGASGFSTELGGRAYLPVKRRRDARDPRIDLFLAGSWVHDALAQEGTLSGCSSGAATTSPPEKITRDGAAFDLGGQATLPNGIYVLGGFGYQWMASESGTLSTRSGGYAIVGNPIDSVQRGTSWPRMLLSLGWTF